MSDKSLRQTLDEIHQTVRVLEARVPERLAERFALVEDRAHNMPCDSLADHFEDHNKETARIVYDRNAFWRKIVASVLITLAGSAALATALILLRAAREWGFL